MGVAILIGLIAVLFLGAPIFAVMLGFTALGDSALGRGFAEQFAGNLVKMLGDATGEKASVLSTVPLFIFMGYVMAESRTADRVVRAAQAGLGWLPGGLAIVTIFACALFTTFTGASGVTIVALGSLIMPSLLKERYSERFALGLVAGTGSVGLLFPPAVPLFVFGTVYGAAETLTKASRGGELIASGAFSTEKFLFAGIVPGLVLLAVLSVFAMVVAIRQGVPRHPFDARELVARTRHALPELVIPFFIILGLAKGMQIPEVASLAVVYVLFVEMVIYRDITPRDLWKITVESMALVGAIFIIILCASALTDYFVNADIPHKLVAWMKSQVSSKWAFLLILNLVLLVVGMMMEIFSAIVVVVPLITPLAIEYGIDPYHLGVVFLLNLELGYITPPVGLNLFITSFKFQRPIVDVTRATLPFLSCMLISLILVTYIPALTVVPEERNGSLVAASLRVKEEVKRSGAVQEVALPDGTVKRLSECAALQDSLSKLDCEGLFTAVTKCRKEAGGATGSECETEVIRDYVELNADEDEDEEADGDADEDEDEEADGDADAKAPGGEAP